MIPFDPLHLQRMAARSDLALFKGQMIGRVVKQFMPPRLRLFGDAECAVCVDVDRTDWVHLKGDLHGGPRFLRPRYMAQTGGTGNAPMRRK